MTHARAGGTAGGALVGAGRGGRDPHGPARVDLRLGALVLARARALAGRHPGGGDREAVTSPHGEARSPRSAAFTPLHRSGRPALAFFESLRMR